MKLSDTQYKAIRNVVNADDLSRWVIVKEYSPMTTNTSHLDQILKNFTIPKKLRILPQDVRMENYRGSKIVDLSCCLTDPCPEWSEFEFEFFYSKTISGLLTWFGK